MHSAAKRTSRLATAAILVMAWMTGCQQKMADQPSYQPLEPCEFFPDHRAARPQVIGTVARGQLQTNVAYFTGRNSRASRRKSALEGTDRETSKRAIDENEDFVSEYPIEIDQPLLEQGKHRYEIYCVVCHDSLGTGQGKIVERGYTRPPPFHIDRLRDAPVGRLFAVVTEGYGSMPSYASQIPPDDRWAIVAYVRALQLSQHFASADLSDPMRQSLEQSDRPNNESPTTTPTERR